MRNKSCCPVYTNHCSINPRSGYLQVFQGQEQNFGVINSQIHLNLQRSSQSAQKSSLKVASIEDISVMRARKQQAEKKELNLSNSCISNSQLSSTSINQNQTQTSQRVEILNSPKLYSATPQTFAKENTSISQQLNVENPLKFYSASQVCNSAKMNFSKSTDEFQKITSSQNNNIQPEIQKLSQQDINKLFNNSINLSQIVDEKTLSGRKNKMKNKTQLKILYSEYQKQSKWSTEKIRALGRLLNLKNVQIYKWYWDRKEEEQMTKKQRMKDLGIEEKIFKITKFIKKSNDQIAEVEVVNKKIHFQIEKQK
eukprot:403350218